jgi:hypothetical protein
MSSEKIRAGGGDDYVALQDLEPGTRLRLRGDILAVVDDNPRDGMWIVVRYLETPAGPVDGDQIEMVMADDVIGLAEIPDTPR